MASSYTSLLGLVLPVTGELSGNWGDVWNDSGTSLIDAAISGTTSLTTDADVTLTTTDGVANEARQAIILWNPASGTVTRNITAPARSKIYTVINASGGTQSIVIRGAGPTTGVTIIKGEAAQVAWNGSDFVKISSSAGDVTVRNLTVTGNTILGDASTDTVQVNGYMGVGGAGLSSVGLVVQSSSLTGVTQQGIYSTVTGNSSATTGVYAFSALPKTAASAFTSATVVGFYASNASKGAGSTITNQHGVYIADQTQGTNNYGITSAVSSDTNKWNIYASGTAQNYFAGNVGIGTTTPANQLVVSSVSNAVIQSVSTSNTTAGRFQATNSDGDIFELRMNGRSAATNPQVAAISTPSNSVPLQFNVSGVEIMRLTNTGLGIGTTPGVPLDVSSPSSQIVGRFTHTVATATSRIYAICGTATGIIQQFGESHATNANELRIASPGGLALQNSGVVRAVIDSSGNMGIGTTSPTFTSGSGLEIERTDANATVRLQRAGTSPSSMEIRSGANTGEIFVTSNSPLLFATNGTEQMRLSAAGGLSIGTTTDPGAGGLITTGNVTLGDASTDTVTVNGYMGVGGAPSAAQGLRVVSTALTGSAQVGVLSSPVGTSAATSSVMSFSATPGTAASVYTVGSTFGLYVADAAKGAGSTITNQYGVYVSDQAQGAANFGLLSNVSSGTNKWNIYVTGTADNYFAGRVGFGSTSLGGASGQYRFSGSITGATSSNGIYYTPTVQSDVTATASIIISQPSTAAASFTLTNLNHFLANQSTIGAGSTVTNQFGFSVASSLTGATNNYGFYGNIGAATGRWNLYMAGTAANYLAGPLTVAATGANGIDLNSNSTDSARLFFSTSTAGQGWSMVNGGGIFRLSPAATAGSSTGLPVLSITQAGQFSFIPDTVTASMTLTATGILLLGTTTASGTANKLQVNSDAFINGLTVGKGLAGLSGNTALGVSALAAVTTGNGNTAIGLQALDANTTGQNNVAIGANAAGANQTAQGLVAIGSNAMLGLTAGDNNIAIGNSAMSSANTGGNNTVVGASALAANTSGAENTAIGYLASSNNTTGSNNAALGRRALWGNTTTSNNVAIGYFALDDVLTAGNSTAVGYNSLGASTGGSNTALGYNAGAVATTGASNLFLGTSAGAVVTTGGKNVIIGSYQGNSGGLDIRTSSNHIVLSDGDANIRQVIDSAGNLGLGVTPSAWVNYNAVQIPGGAIAGTAASFRLEMIQNAYYSGSSYYYVATSAASIYRQSLGAHIWYNAPSGTAGAAATFTQAMTLDADGDLGIGTTSPATKLDVAGAGTFKVDGSGSTTPLILRNNNTASTQVVKLAFDSNGAIKASINAAVYNNDYMAFNVGSDTERVRIDNVGNVQMQTGSAVVWAPAPAAISTTATLTNANIQGQIINTTGTSYTVTMPLGTTMETLVPWAAVNLGYNFTVINTASGTITMAVNTGVTSLGALTIATGTSAQFRIRRTAANTFILYRMS